MYLRQASRCRRSDPEHKTTFAYQHYIKTVAEFSDRFLSQPQRYTPIATQPNPQQQSRMLWRIVSLSHDVIPTPCSPVASANPETDVTKRRSRRYADYCWAVIRGLSRKDSRVAVTMAVTMAVAGVTPATIYLPFPMLCFSGALVGA